MALTTHSQMFVRATKLSRDANILRQPTIPLFHIDASILAVRQCSQARACFHRPTPPRARATYSRSSRRTARPSSACAWGVARGVRITTRTAHREALIVRGTGYEVMI